jgi:hypothetical protein
MLNQGCTSSGSQVAVTTSFCTVAPNICGSSVWNLLHVTLQGFRNLKWLLDILKICAALLYNLEFVFNTARSRIIVCYRNVKTITMPYQSAQRYIHIQDMYLTETFSTEQKKLLHKDLREDARRKRIYLTYQFTRKKGNV